MSACMHQITVKVINMNWLLKYIDVAGFLFKSAHTLSEFALSTPTIHSLETAVLL